MFSGLWQEGGGASTCIVHSAIDSKACLSAVTDKMKKDKCEPCVSIKNFLDCW